jgi:hypothetical protein
MKAPVSRLQHGWAAGSCGQVIKLLQEARLLRPELLLHIPGQLADGALAGHQLTAYPGRWALSGPGPVDRLTAGGQLLMPDTGRCSTMAAA